MRALPVAALMLTSFGCRTANRAHELRSTDEAAVIRFMDSAVAAALPAKSDEDVRIRIATDVPPAGYALVEVSLQDSEEHGHVLVLSEPTSGRLLPLLIGGTEGRSLELRLRRQRYPRPLTHDLLDDALAKLGGKVLRAQVDGLVDGTYHGSVLVVAHGRTIRLDARPSDAIALAVGAEAAIVVATDLLEKRGVSMSEVGAASPHAGSEPIAL